MSPLAFLGLYVLACLGAFALGLRFVGAREEKPGVTVDQSRRFGRLLMMTATALLIIPVAAWLHGDLKLQGLSR
jgi:hypothetical protein